MSSKGQLKREIKKCRLTIEEMSVRDHVHNQHWFRQFFCRKSLTKWTLSGSTNTQAR